MNLFAVYLGGRAKKCNTELHDVVFAAGETIKDTYEQLMDLWFGSVRGLHIDSWIQLKHVDGYKITLSEQPSTNNKKLFFVNLGAYQSGVFSELHACTFLVAEIKREVIERAKEKLLSGRNFVHTDDLFDVDDCFEILKVKGLHLNLEESSEPENLKPNNGYHIVPKSLVENYLKRFPERDL